MDTKDSLNKMDFGSQEKLPDYPNSPVTGWRHYGIIDHAEKMIRKRLSDLNLDGKVFFVGFRVTYQVTDPDSDASKEYTMGFGKKMGEEDPGNPDESPLGDEFHYTLFREVTELVRKNTSQEYSSSDLQTSMYILLAWPSGSANIMMQCRTWCNLPTQYKCVMHVKRGYAYQCDPNWGCSC